MLASDASQRRQASPEPRATGATFHVPAVRSFPQGHAAGARWGATNQRGSSISTTAPAARTPVRRVFPG